VDQIPLRIDSVRNTRAGIYLASDAALLHKSVSRSTVAIISCRGVWSTSCKMSLAVRSITSSRLVNQGSETLSHTQYQPDYRRYILELMTPPKVLTLCLANNKPHTEGQKFDFNAVKDSHSSSDYGWRARMSKATLSWMYCGILHL
jgi:cobalamin biosynthesis Mg chelatase CobN